MEEAPLAPLVSGPIIPCFCTRPRTLWLFHSRRAACPPPPRSLRPPTLRLPRLMNACLRRTAPSRTCGSKRENTLRRSGYSRNNGRTGRGFVKLQLRDCSVLLGCRCRLINVIMTRRRRVAMLLINPNTCQFELACSFLALGFISNSISLGPVRNSIWMCVFPRLHTK